MNQVFHLYRLQMEKFKSNLIQKYKMNRSVICIMYKIFSIRYNVFNPGQYSFGCHWISKST